MQLFIVGTNQILFSFSVPKIANVHFRFFRVEIRNTLASSNKNINSQNATEQWQLFKLRKGLC